MEQCDYLLPGHDGALSRGTAPEDTMCLREKNHEGSHLCRVSHGRIIVWSPDEECEDCVKAGYDCCECFVWGEASAKTIEKLAKFLK